MLRFLPYITNIGTSNSSNSYVVAATFPVILNVCFYGLISITVIPFPTAPNFAALTDAEVRNMEGAERRAVEARIQCLRNIHTLLDAATLQLQQYLSVLTVLG